MLNRGFGMDRNAAVTARDDGDGESDKLAVVLYSAMEIYHNSEFRSMPSTTPVVVQLPFCIGRNKCCLRINKLLLLITEQRRPPVERAHCDLNLSKAK
jgi:hypothetical protein